DMSMKLNEKFGFLQNSDMFSHISNLKYIPRWAVLAVDVFLCVFSFYIANYLSSKFYHVLDSNLLFLFHTKLGLLISLQIVFFWIFHTYSGVLRYSGYVDASKLLLAVSSNILVLVLLNLVVGNAAGEYIYTYSSLVIYAILSFLLLFFLRLGTKTIYDYFSQNSGQVVPAMIYGTQNDAIGIAKMLRSSHDNKYKLTGFIDDDKNATERVIMGLKVFHLNEKNIVRLMAKTKAIIVTPSKLKQINPDKDLDIFLNNHLSILTSPPMSIWKNEMPTIRQIKSIQIEDLLERPKIEISSENITKQLHGAVILITGAAGSIGSEIVRQVTKYNPKLIVLLDQAESPMHILKLELDEQYPELNFSVFLGDVRNKERMEYLIELFRPDYIYHAAAYKHVPLIEDNPVESVQVNIQGTKILADLAVKYKVKRFVMISTDKAVNPTNVMGASKRIAEIYVQSLNRKLQAESSDNTKFITTRFGNVLGSNGSVIPHFKAQIEKGGPVTVTHPEIIRYFMTIPEACMLVLEAGSMGEGGEIFIFDMGSPVKIVNLARKMIRLAGFTPEVDIKIEYTGLRPGEKLYEELLNKKEVTVETHNPKIMIAKVQEYEYEIISTQIDELIQYSFLCKNFLTVSLMKKIVPEFLSKNSQYERLDV
ncbi:MAG TPA: nucleoside-diphosphate sugar epimerase/dehydratase, partial [Paludibacter sp.]|nr:nucleoside-diphosphate sugar epimerase/dehydratase [Paludibacter sp.]